jgi:D-alanyl-lipoteichoic acid acyltransferase DltB (MBOAT superfamily)
MTLSRFLRDYLYIPLGGNRGGKWRTYRNLMLTMVIGGLWHGAAWTFVVWGGIHGLVLAGERWLADRRAAAGLPEPADTPARRVGRWFVTFHVVCLAWVFFRAQTFEGAWLMLRGLTNPGASPLITGMLVFTIGAMVVSQFIPSDVVQRLEVLYSKLALVPQAVILAVFFFLLDATGPAGVAPFIYFQF